MKDSEETFNLLNGLEIFSADESSSDHKTYVTSSSQLTTIAPIYTAWNEEHEMKLRVIMNYVGNIIFLFVWKPNNSFKNL